ncbi:AbrB/MazE/SpoVT family DNA-binding domain-containing protein [Zhaonella formicivorans]|uniref:AbrB/MazE/SpoVT family DNA-binding domain-containing protein n=1 Tax=Zhaonella formicivorans TaxID=2528593 RepID=UPI0010ED9B47|nr:AbrB/MazE/SpoVT family DNA-binding domain-containing protein [Zhaonella formicivorans]
MQIDVIRIGNSKGVRIPAALLKQCGIDKRVEVEVQENCIILKPVKIPREGWAAAFRRMNRNGDDVLLLPDELDNDLLEEWDEY